MSNNYPTSYNEFKKLQDLRKHKDFKKGFIRFATRYRLASCFTEIKAEGIGKTINGYNVVLKIFLVYTAYEQLLQSAVGLHVFGLQAVEKNYIKNENLANKLRKNKLLIDFLIEHSTNSILISQLASFKNFKNNDIVCVSYALRNVFAHGELTATAVGTTFAWQRKDMLELADYLLSYCDETFTKCVEKLR